MSRIASYAFLGLQKLLPKHLLTAIVYRLARIRTPWLKNFLIQRFVQLYAVNTAEVAQSVPGDFVDFNAFFSRELVAGTRPIDAASRSIVSPVDGTVSTCGSIRNDSIFQAKGLHYNIDDLLATDVDEARHYHGGSFATIYLAPYNYHRVHMPVAGKLMSAVYVPGDLFSVNKSTVSLLPNLFTRNERLVCHFECEFGRMVFVMIGAMNVGSISTPWSGEIRPRSGGVSALIDIHRKGQTTALDKGALIGWFNMGSTIIMMVPSGCCEWDARLEHGSIVKMGQAIGSLATAARN